MRKLLGIAAAAMLAIGSAHASPMLIEPTADGSDVDAYITSSKCVGCFVDTTLSADLDSVEAWLDTGDSMTFDFFDVVVGGLVGGAEIAVNATLGLISPTAAGTGNGLGGFASFLFAFNGVQLEWIQPDAIDLGDGTFLGISFENLYEFGIGNTFNVSATITRYAAVPEPGTAALLLIGLFALWFGSRRKSAAGQSQFSGVAAA